MDYVVLVALVLQASVGAKLLIDWWRSTPPSPTAFLHAGVTDAALILWIVYLITDTTALAWVSFGVVLLGNILGDLLLIAGWRGRTGQGSSFFKDYGAAAMAVMKGQHSPVATLHTAGAGIVTVLTLIGCILA